MQTVAKTVMWRARRESNKYIELLLPDNKANDKAAVKKIIKSGIKKHINETI